ncbi:MAG: methylenetetrahydrofolate reductase [NAD(P)H] [Pseudomonadota bacterium]
MTTPNLSFEFFPPKDLKGSFKLWETAQALLPLAPRYVSVTYGAGGSTRQLTHETVEALQQQGARVAAHLTCVGASRAETMEIAERYWAAGVRDIVALRGDAPNGESFVPHAEGFNSSLDLIEALSARGFEVQVGAYPDPHPESRGRAADIEWLRAKSQAGATKAVTQFFFDADTFLRFRDDCADAGVTAEIVPGILPIHNWKSAQSFATRCGVDIPAELAQGFEAATRDNRTELFALAHATELCTELMDAGVDQMHFYTLNRPELTRDICRALGAEMEDTLREVA